MNPSLRSLVDTMETLLDETSQIVKIHEGALADVMTSDVGRLARYRCTAYLGQLGIRDAEVLAKMSNHFVRRAIDVLEGAEEAAINNRLVSVSLELTDNYVQKWLIGIEKQIDLRGGMSRCGELALKMGCVLAKYPHAIESVEAALPLFKDDVTLSMPAQPPNNPATFAEQPLTASKGGILSELWMFVSSMARNWTTTNLPRIHLSPSLDRRSR